MLEQRPVLHDSSDLQAAWRVWFNRRQAITTYMQQAYSYIPADIVSSIVLSAEMYATCNDDLFHKTVFLKCNDTSTDV